MKHLFGQLFFTSIVLFVVFGKMVFGDSYIQMIGYADNIVGFVNLLVFIIMIMLVWSHANIDELFEKSPPKTQISEMFIMQNYVYYTVIVLLYVMSGWFFSALVWSVTGMLSIALMEENNKVFNKLNPTKAKSPLQEMADD